MSGNSIQVTRSLFQEREGGAVPTLPHQFEVEVILPEEAEACYEKWHYLGKQDFLATIHFGAKTPGELWGAISYGTPNASGLNGYWTPETQDGWWEIKRLALSDDLPKNSESRFIAISLRFLRKFYPVKGVVTYADDGVGHTGIIYRASGFNYKGLTEPKNDYWVDGEIQQRGSTTGMGGEWKPRSRKHLFVKDFRVVGNSLANKNTKVYLA
jgi:hypothetical protein